jgi:hypothetical protein
MRALPKIETAGWIVCRRSVAVDELCDNLEHPPRLARRGLRAFHELGSEAWNLGDATVMAGPHGMK